MIRGGAVALVRGVATTALRTNPTTICSATAVIAVHLA